MKQVTDMQRFSERRLKENEVIFRDANKSVQEFVEEHTGSAKMVVSFYCECSRTDCRERIGLTTELYGDLHDNRKQFVTIIGHEIPAIEKIVRREHGYNIVEKDGTVPSIDDINVVLAELATE